MPVPLIETRSLTKSYGDVHALSDCNLEVSRGEVFGLLGPNGSGKSTLIRMLMGFLRPTSGEAKIAGLDCWRQSVAVHAKTAYLPGDARLFRQMRGRDVIRFFAAARKGADPRRSIEFAERLDLDFSRPVATYSTGMRQKLALACVLGANTELVILDEPTANLDPTVRSEVLSLVRETKNAGRTVVFSSHVMEEVEEACDRVAILRKGVLAHSQSMAELRKRHRIHARLEGKLPAPPASLAGELEIHARDDTVTMLTAGELSRLLGWLATAPLAEVRIEPVGLRAVYDRVHATGRNPNGALNDK